MTAHAEQPLPAVHDLLGHSSVTMTERYAHLAPENVLAAVAALNSVSRFCHAERKEPSGEPLSSLFLAPRPGLEPGTCGL